MYAQDKSYDKTTWKKQVRDEFRKEILEYLKEEFVFYQIMIKSNDIEDFVEIHYRKIIGNVFAFEDQKGNKVLLYAERKNQNDRHDKSYTFDAKKDSHVDGDVLIIPIKDRDALYRIRNIELGYYDYLNPDIECKEYALVGYYKSKEHLEWIRENGIYNIPTKQRGQAVRLNDAHIFATYIILHNEELGNYVFRTIGETICKISKENLPKGTYTPKHDDYFVYEIDVDTQIDRQIEILINASRFKERLKHKKPIFIKIDVLRNLSKEVSIDDFRYKIEEETTFNSMVAEDSHTCDK